MKNTLRLDDTVTNDLLSEIVSYFFSQEKYGYFFSE